MSIPQLSAVVLCYQAGPLAADFYQRLKRSIETVTASYEIILVGNYSNTTDPTPQIVTQLAQQDPHVMAITLQKHGGRGWDALSGLQRATGQYVCLIEGDDQLKPELVAQVFKKITQEDLDFVKTNRVTRGDGFQRKIISLLFNIFFKLLYGNGHFGDVNSTPKIMKRTDLAQMQLSDSGWFLDTQIMTEVSRLKLKTAEVPVIFYSNEHRESFVGLKAMWEVASKMILYRLGIYRLFWPNIPSSQSPVTKTTGT